jgi:hypothetical protein
MAHIILNLAKKSLSFERKSSRLADTEWAATMNATADKRR